MLFSLEALIVVKEDERDHVDIDHPEFTKEQRIKFITEREESIKALKRTIERVKSSAITFIN